MRPLWWINNSLISCFQSEKFKCKVRKLGIQTKCMPFYQLYFFFVFAGFLFSMSWKEASRQQMFQKQEYILEFHNKCICSLLYSIIIMPQEMLITDMNVNRATAINICYMEQIWVEHIIFWDLTILIIMTFTEPFFNLEFILQPPKMT